MTPTFPPQSGPAPTQPRPVAQPPVPLRSAAPTPEGLARASASGEATARAFRALLGGKTSAFEEAELIDASGDGTAFATGGHAAVQVDAGAPAAGSATMIDPAAAESVDRMAKAVAEALSRGRDPVFTIRFNDPAALSEGALLIRDAGGALTVRLEGVAATALALPARALEDQLRAALDRRRVRLGRLEWGAPARPPLTR